MKSPHSHSGAGGHGHGVEGSHGHGVESGEGFVPAPRPPGAESPQLAEGAGRGMTLFFDMQSGIAGDMTISALIDMGVPISVIQDAVLSLGLGSVRLEVQTGFAGAIGCTHLNVDFEPQQAERSFPQIETLIQNSSLDEETKSCSLAIFSRLAQAEAKVHRTTLEHVHFHEVGAVDAIVDIVGSARALCYLGATVKGSPVPLGRGYVSCRHGTLPLPAPAALECLTSVPTVASGLDRELVTPTGAAIIATVAEEFGQWFALTPKHVGWGAGTRGLPDRPNALRLVLGEESKKLPRAEHVLLEANIDDMTAEWAAFSLDRVMEQGALDVWISPATMKKGRPGMVFSALSTVALSARVARAILEETSSIGVRQSLVSRSELERTIQELSSPWGPVRIKTSQLGEGRLRHKPEFEDVARISRENDLSFQTVLDFVQAHLARLGEK